MIFNSFDYEEYNDGGELRCPRCKWYFCSLTRPYILPCDHNICEKCIDYLKNEKKNICPFCNKEFNPKEFDLLQVNYSFLNLINKIINTKIIFCKKCHKLINWKDHYSKCDQAFFIEPLDIINKLKTTFEKSNIAIKLYNNRKNLVLGYKNKIISKLKFIIDVIHKKNKSSVVDDFGKFLKNILSIKNVDFKKFKKNIFYFLELCLQYKNIFDINEILNTLEIASPGYIKIYKTKKNILDNNILPKNNLINKNNFFDKNNHNFNNIQFIKYRQKEEINSRLYIIKEKNKIYSIKNNNENIRINNIIENNKIQNFNNNDNIEEEKKDPKMKRAKTTSKIKNKKFDIMDLLGQPSLEMESFNKIIVGLKDIKVMKFKTKKEEKENSDIKDSEINNKIQLRNIDNNVSKNNILSRSYKKNKNEVKIKINQKEKNKDIFPANFLRTIDKSIDMNNKIKDRYQNEIKQDNIPIIIEEVSQENDNENGKIILINNQKKEVKKMGKIFKEFNNIKKEVESLEEYNSLINNLYSYIINKIEINILLLNDILNSNFILLLNKITNNHHIYKKNNIISLVENSQQIIIYNIVKKEYKYKNLDNILKNNFAFNNSMCIEYDDKDLIFLSGGETNINNYRSDTFIIINIEKENIEFEGNLPSKKSFHSNIFFNEKLYLIGGLEENKKCSSSCYYYSVNYKKWINLPNLNKPRANCSLCIQNNTFLYSFRGRDDNYDIDSIEYINLNNINKLWTLFTPIDYGYVWHPAENSLVLNYNEEKILICGGEDIKGNLFKETFLLETNSNKIYRGKDLLLASSFRFQGGIYSDEIFGIDIKNNYNIRNKIGIHLYNFESNEWKLMLV